MAQRAEPDPVKAFVAVLAPQGALIDRVVELLAREVGPLERASERFPFAHTGYYAEELGAEPLFRCFLPLEALIDPGALPELKAAAVRVEQALGVAGRRRVNLDPGYLDYGKVVLASYKYGGQKVYLREGVYADVILLYQKGRFIPFAWTFPDFVGGTYDQLLLALRVRYRKQVRQGRVAQGGGA